MDDLSRLAPTLKGALELEAFGTADGAVESNPSHDLGIYKLLGAAADFPDTVIGLMPDFFKLLDDRKLHPDTSLLAVTSPVVAADARRMGLVERIEDSGALVLEGMCFYQSYAREMGEANGWKRLMTNSVKLVNIIGGYGYEPTLSNMENCVASAIAGEIV